MVFVIHSHSSDSPPFSLAVVCVISPFLARDEVMILEAVGSVNPCTNPIGPKLSRRLYFQNQVFRISRGS